MDKIIIRDIEVWYCVGATDAERSKPQRLLLSVELECDFSRAAESDDLTHTIDYFALSQRLLDFGKDRSWRLIEKLADDLANWILIQFKPAVVWIEVKKFAVPQAAWVAVQVKRQSQQT